MQIEGAIIREQGVTFGIVIVKPHVTQSDHAAHQTRTSIQGQLAEFSGIPLILASQDHQGRFLYQGRTDIVSFLASISSSRIPWKRYHYN